MGLDVFIKQWGQPKAWQCYANEEPGDSEQFSYIEFPSAKYPDHLFKVGYFRSSTNSSGINHKLRNTIGINLHSIFNPPLEGAYHFQPDWKLAKSIAQKAIRDLKDYIAKGGYSVLTVDCDLFGDRQKSGIASEALALHKFQEILEKHSDSPVGNFTSCEGHFFLNEPLKVVGVIPGVSDVFKVKCNYVIYKDDSWDWYLQALEIVEETCDWVLSQADIDCYCLAWSG